MNRRHPSRLRRASITALILISAVAIHAVGGISAQPNPGIDPCTRALASRGTPAALATPEPAANRQIVTQTVMNFASCFNRHNWDGVLALTDSDFRASFIGASTDSETRDRLDALDARGLLPQIRIRSIEESGASGTRFVTLAVTWLGWNGLHRELWRLQSAGADWVLSGRSTDRPQISGVAVGIQLTIGEDKLIAPRADVVNPGTVILAFENRRDDVVTALILAVPPNATAVEVIELCNDPDAGIEPAGSISAEPGTIVYLPLIDLPPGHYATLTGPDPCMEQTPIQIGQIVMLDVSE